MQRRLLLIALVFVAGFGAGYGLTWLLVGSPERGPAPGPSGPSPVPTASADVVSGDTAPPSAPPAGDTSNPTPDVAVVPDTVLLAPDTAVPTDAASPDTAGPVEVAEPEPKEWERCLNKVCRLDFGGVNGAISLRRGKFDHGATVDWEKDFGRAEKIGSLDSDKTIRLEVLAIGLADGEPAAAYVNRKLKKTTQTGVIALRIGDKRLSLVPIEE
jgi:hypothetical protein